MNQNTEKPDAQEESKLHLCEVCNRTFKWKSHLLIHARTHTGERPYACELCPKAFQRREHLNAHVFTHTSEKPFVCECCNKGYRSRDTLRKHLSVQTEKKTVRLLNCKVCDKTLTTKSSLTKHLLYMHSEENAKKCEVCKDSSKRDCQHKEFVRRPHECDVCQKRFRKRSHLRDHLLIHTEKKPHPCTLCGRSFREKSTLRRHLRIHTGEKPYTCDVCQRSFVEKKTLEGHFLKAHSEGKPRDTTVVDLANRDALIQTGNLQC